jgi:hypothetical protein
MLADFPAVIPCTFCSAAPGLVLQDADTPA